MFAHLPSLNALRFFEAAARLGSFTEAGVELHVSTAAVSYQIKTLEEQLGHELFVRHSRSVELNELGQALAESVQLALRQLSEGVRDITEAGSRGVLRISVLPSFSQHWFLARLQRFYAGNPGIKLRLEATQTVVDLRASELHAAVRYGLGSWPRVRSRLLFTEQTFPVCSPAYAANLPELSDVRQLPDHELLHDTALPWASFFASLGLPDLDIPRGSTFDDAGLLVYAAKAGHGIALGRGLLVTDALQSGELVRLTEARVPSDYSYYFVCPEANLLLPKVSALYDWLIAEGSQLDPSVAELAPG